MRARKILLVDDSVKFRISVRKTLGRAFAVVEADSPEGFRREFHPALFDLVILDMRLESDREGLELLREILAQDELQPVIMVSAYGDTDAVLEATEGGALMFLHKQEFTPELLARMVEAVLEQARVRRHLATLQQRVRVPDPLSLTAGNPAVKKAALQVERAADDPDAVVVVSGESGAGHDLAAAGIHERSARRASAAFLIATGRGAQLDDLRELLLGPAKQKRATRKSGLVRDAHGGVLFIDGFDQIDADYQECLLEAARGRQVEGDSGPPLDVQWVLGVDASNATKVGALVRGRLPERRVIEVSLPALRERREDIPLLAAYFLQDLRRTGSTSAQAFSREAMQAMEAWSWPGNLHELRAVIAHAGVQALVDGSDEIRPAHLPGKLTEPEVTGKLNIHRFLARAEADLVARALESHQPKNKTQLAELLGYTDRFTIGRRMRKLLGENPDLRKRYPKLEGMFGPGIPDS
jgi:DNA-binding NtrC family response regulator